MPQYERGVYEPSDEVRVFDGSEEEEDVEGSRLPLLIVLALLVLAMFAGVVWLAYTQGVARGRTETPVIAAAAGPARIAPQNPGGAQQPYQGFKIYEQPAPPDDDTASSQPASPPAKQAAAAPAPPPASQMAAAAPTSEMKPSEATSLPEAKPAPVTPAPAKLTPALAKPAAAPIVAAAKPAPPVAKPIPAPVSKPVPQPAPLMIGPATAPPRALGAAAAPAATAAPAASGAYVLQIGAYKSQGDADAAWRTYKGKHAALLSGYESNIQQADLGDKGTWYRLRIAGFASKDIASALCDRLKADGGVCFLGK